MRKPMTEDRYALEMKKLQERNAQREMRRNLHDERMKSRPTLKLPTTSKLVLAGMIAVCLEIIIFSEYIMIITFNTDSLYALIAVPAALAATIWGYYSKSKAQNTVGGITYDMAMAELEMSQMDSPEPEDAGLDVADISNNAVG